MCRLLGGECAERTSAADQEVGCLLQGSTIALSMPTAALARPSQRGGEVAPAGQQRLAPPAPALELALKGWLGLGKHRGGSRKAAGRCGAASQVASFLRVFGVFVWEPVVVVLGLAAGLGGLFGVAMILSDE